MVVRLVMTAIFLGLTGVLGFFAVQNANRYYEANYPPDGTETVQATVLEVETEELCGQTARTIRRCTTEVDGLEIRLPDDSTVNTDAHAVYSPGDTVEAFQDSEGDWQVEGSFTKGWVARTFGFTAAGAVAFLVLTVVFVRDSRRGPRAAPPKDPEQPDQPEQPLSAP